MKNGSAPVRPANYMRSRSPRRANFESASAILEKALKKYGLDERITRYRFVNYWHEIVGPGIAARSRPEYIRNKTLFVKVSDSSWAQELSYQKAIILKRLQKFLEAPESVSELRFFVGSLG